MVQVKLVLLVLAFVLLLLQSMGVPSQRVQLGWLGLALWVLAILLT